jgi:hypothetical protein
MPKQMTRKPFSLPLAVLLEAETFDLSAKDTIKAVADVMAGAACKIHDKDEDSGEAITVYYTCHTIIDHLFKKEYAQARFLLENF